MLRLLQWLFYGHIHEWTTLGSGNIEHSRDEDKMCGIYYILKCEKCGQIKMVKLYS